MVFFEVLDTVMFSMMLSMLGMSMSGFIPPQDMPQDTVDEDDGGGFNFDVGF